MNTVVVMDIGKTNAKLCVVDGVSGALVDSDTMQTPTLDVPPYPQLDTSAIWQWYVAGLARIQQSRCIDTIVVTAHGATAALLNDDGLVLPVMDYEFVGLDEYRDEYDSLCDSFEHTYSPKLPLGLNVGRQLYWQRKRYPQQFEQAQYLVPYAQYWSWLLTGKAVAEVSTIGSHTDLWNPLEKRYSDFAERQGFAKLFPPLMHAGDSLGSVTADVQKATGIDNSCNVLVGIHDSNASLLPWIHSRDVPLTVMSTGTWVIIFSLGTPLQGLEAERDCTANVTIYSEPVACARFMGGREFAAIAGTAAKTNTTVSISDVLAVIELGALALPVFADTGGPFPGGEGLVVSQAPLTASQTQALASLYCALVSDESLNLCNSAGDIIVEGAFAKNEILLQCLSVFRGEQKLFASADSTGTTMGAAMLATDLTQSAAARDGHARPDKQPDKQLKKQAGASGITAPALTQAVVTDSLFRNKLLEYRSFWQSKVRQHRQDQSHS